MGIIMCLVYTFFSSFSFVIIYVWKELDHCSFPLMAPRNKHGIQSLWFIILLVCIHFDTDWFSFLFRIFDFAINFQMSIAVLPLLFTLNTWIPLFRYGVRLPLLLPLSSSFSSSLSACIYSMKQPKSFVLNNEPSIYRSCAQSTLRMRTLLGCDVYLQCPTVLYKI